MLATLCLLASAAGCTGAGSHPPPGSSPPSVSQPSPSFSSPDVADVATLWQTPAQACPGNYPVPLVIETEVQIEIEYLRDVVACADADGALTYLQDDGDAVWKPRATRQSNVTYFNENLRARSYRAAVTDRYAYALLTPGQKLVVSAPPGDVAWDLDLPLSVSYHLHDALANEIQSYGQDVLTKALQRKSAKGAALATCTISGYQILDEAADLDQQPLSEWMMQGVGDASGVSSCVSAWRAADQVEIRTGQPRTLTADALPKIRYTQAEVLTKVDTNLTRLSQAGKIVKFLLRFK
jgi:hypothetical protein